MWLSTIQFIKVLDAQKFVIACLTLICKKGPDSIEELVKSDSFRLLLDPELYISNENDVDNLLSIILSEDYSDTIL